MAVAPEGDTTGQRARSKRVVNEEIVQDRAPDLDTNLQSSHEAPAAWLAGLVGECALGGGRPVRASGVRGARVLGAAREGLLQFRQAVRGHRRDEGSELETFRLETRESRCSQFAT